MNKRIFFRLAMAIVLLGTVGQSVTAATVRSSGAFGDDDDVSVFSFGVVGTAPSQVTITTNSYATGGFDPVLSLFYGANGAFNDGEFIDESFDRSTTDFDARIQRDLAPGEYLVAVTQWDNIAFLPSILDGFAYTKMASGSDLNNLMFPGLDPDFTGDLSSCPGGPPFCDIDGNTRTGQWAAQVSGKYVVPLPGAVWLFISALGLLVPLARRRG